MQYLISTITMNCQIFNSQTTGTCREKGGGGNEIHAPSACGLGIKYLTVHCYRWN
jgi:hypothetical protein